MAVCIASLLQNEPEVECGGTHWLLLELVDTVQTANHLRRSTTEGGGKTLSLKRAGREGGGGD